MKTCIQIEYKKIDKEKLYIYNPKVMEYKNINYDEFCRTFIGWSIIDEKHFHDLQGKKYYNEYTLQPPDGPKLILIISHIYYKKRVQITFYISPNRNDLHDFTIGTKQVKQIETKEDNKYVIDLGSLSNIRSKIPTFDHSIARSLIVFFYN